ncbi:hypothetical protein G6F46_012727 [Rhizopus delemar]|uniref:Uncharacterized protein n=2 Tax=Rhizopus TaxID=4842 RepID=A0A9P6YQV8_9FUNG|nr:hypothetical protein G6F36_012127 [Rhizopus arrhizus]KAG1457782.1 hypothetical protein G6F55_005725 [Rhizopus delemar]KAG1487403.1 hypothetical protein G6F54_012682 [Rhizopus delemar]KAG1493862.1 hypothetical protein G6F53_012677 [Rhizopus delemar]KAG1503592.1 hypothetical protein G6F52_012263 [Rhizopus delemar]
MTTAGYPEKSLPSLLLSCEAAWQGKSSLSATPTSKEVIELAPPKHTIADVLKAVMEATATATGIGQRKQAVLENGGDIWDIVMLETNTMVANCTYSDGKADNTTKFVMFEQS